MSAENLNNANNAYLKALNSKNPENIEIAIVDLANKIDDMKKWLTNYLVPASRAGQTLEKLKIKVKKDMGGKQQQNIWLMKHHKQNLLMKKSLQIL